jgi:hypothetical protein
MTAGVDKVSLVIGDDEIVVDNSFGVRGVVDAKHVDISIDLKDKNDKELFLLSGKTGWEEFNSLIDMGVSDTELLARLDGDELFRAGFDSVYVRLMDGMNNMTAGVDKFAMALDAEVVIETTLEVSKHQEQWGVLWLLFKHGEEMLAVEGQMAVVVGDVHACRCLWPDRTVEVQKFLLRVDGEEKIDTTMTAYMTEVEDSRVNLHMAVDLQMFVSVEQEEYLNLQGMHADFTSGGNSLSIASRMYGILYADEVFNGTLSVDKLDAQWTIYTNNFELLPLRITAAPSVAPTYATELEVSFEQVGPLYVLQTAGSAVLPT